MKHTMTAAEYRKAVRSAKRVLAFFKFQPDCAKMHGWPISKAHALRAAQGLKPDGACYAAWADAPDCTILFVG
jgi:hypothetical protein